MKQSWLAALAAIVFIVVPLTLVLSTCEARAYNLGNIRKTEKTWVNEIPCAGEFKCFHTRWAAKKAVTNLLRVYWNRYGINTITKVMMRYSPPVENNTYAVIRSMSSITGYSPSEVLDMTDPAILNNLTEAIIRIEGTGQ